MDQNIKTCLGTLLLFHHNIDVQGSQCSNPLYFGTAPWVAALIGWDVPPDHKQDHIQTSAALEVSDCFAMNRILINFCQL